MRGFRARGGQRYRERPPTATRYLRGGGGGGRDLRGFEGGQGLRVRPHTAGLFAGRRPRRNYAGRTPPQLPP